jgi:hypothetical protein
MAIFRFSVYNTEARQSEEHGIHRRGAEGAEKTGVCRGCVIVEGREG